MVQYYFIDLAPQLQTQREQDGHSFTSVFRPPALTLSYRRFVVVKVLLLFCDTINAEGMPCDQKSTTDLHYRRLFDKFAVLCRCCHATNSLS
eukprot:3136389-Amphidinium_carterae.2